MRNRLASPSIGPQRKLSIQKKHNCPPFEWQKVHVIAKMALVDEYDFAQI